MPEGRKVARETGLEPATSGVTGRRSNQLSYSRKIALRSAQTVGIKGGGTSSQGIVAPQKLSSFPNGSH